MVGAKGGVDPIEIDGAFCKVGSVKGYFKYLGIHMSPIGVVSHEVGRLQHKLFEIYDMLERKQVSPIEARYVINTVIVGVLQYSMQVVGLPRAFLRKLDARSARVMKLKCGIGVNAPVEEVFAEVKIMGLGITNFVDLQDAITITEMIVRLNSESLAGEVARARMMATKMNQGVVSCPLDREGLEESGVKRFSGHTFQYLQINRLVIT